MVGIQRGNYFTIEAGIEQQRKQIKIKKPKTLAFQGIVEYAWKPNTIAFKPGAWLKTGSLKGVQAYSGYVRTAKNNWFAISILVNDRLAEKSKIAMDDVVEWLYANN